MSALLRVRRLAVRRLAASFIVVAIGETAIGIASSAGAVAGTTSRSTSMRSRRAEPGGAWFLDRQLGGPYELQMGDILYARGGSGSSARSWSSGDPWWAIPVDDRRRSSGAGTGVVDVAAHGGLSHLAVHPGPVYHGHPVIWVAAFAAAGLRFGWPGALIWLKPSLFPFAAIGFRHIGWWIVVAALVLARCPSSARRANGSRHARRSWRRTALLGRRHPDGHHPVLAMARTTDARSARGSALRWSAGARRGSSSGRGPRRDLKAPALECNGQGIEHGRRTRKVRRRGSCEASGDLDGRADRAENGADLSAQEDEGDDRDDRDEREDQRVLRETLASSSRGSEATSVRKTFTYMTSEGEFDRDQIPGFARIEPAAPGGR